MRRSTSIRLAKRRRPTIPLWRGSIPRLANEKHLTKGYAMDTDAGEADLTTVERLNVQRSIIVHLMWLVAFARAKDPTENDQRKILTEIENAADTFRRIAKL